MPGDYVKQLQLAKQLEQKAREAARGRETAEAKIEEATALLSKVKGMQATSAETEKLLTLANQSYADKDYKEALSYAVKSVEASFRARKERLQEMLREARSLLERVAELGRAEPDTEKALKKASEAIDSGDLDEAFTMSKDAWDIAERNANRVLSEAFGSAQSSLLFAERLELKVDKQKTVLRNCREALESGDVGKSVELIRSLSGTLRSMTLDVFVKRAAKIETFLSLEKGLPLQLEDANAKMAKARELISYGRVEEAFNALDEVEDIFSRAFGRVAGQRISELKKRAEDVSRWKKVELGDLEGDARRLELEERYQEALSLLESARRKVRDAEKDVLLRYMAVMQPRLKLAHLTRKDVSPALRMMDEAQGAAGGRPRSRVRACRGSQRHHRGTSSGIRPGGEGAEERPGAALPMRRPWSELHGRKQANGRREKAGHAGRLFPGRGDAAGLAALLSPIVGEPFRHGHHAAGDEAGLGHAPGR